MTESQDKSPRRGRDREEAEERFMHLYWEARKAMEFDVAAAEQRCLRLQDEARLQFQANLAAIDAEEEGRP